MRLKEKLVDFCLKARVPLASLDKHVIVKEELLEEYARRLDNPVISEAPCFLPEYTRARLLEPRENLRRTMVEMYGVEVVDSWEGDAFVNVSPKRARETLIDVMESPTNRVVFVARERVVNQALSEPGFPDYSPLTVLARLYFDLEGFLLDSSWFYPPPPSPMGALEMERRRDPVPGFYRFLKRVFSSKEKIGDKRAFQMDPEELLDHYLNL